MTSIYKLAVGGALLVGGLSGCGLARPRDPAPFDCEAIDRAEERFPEECGEGEEVEPGTEDGGTADAGTEGMP